MSSCISLRFLTATELPTLFARTEESKIEEGRTSQEMSRHDLMFNNAMKFQKEAERIEDALHDPKIFGVKCWYSDARLIEDGAEVAFLGINPGGDKDSQDLDKKAGSLKFPYTRKGYSSWLDETWLRTNHQEAVYELFQTIYGAEWETKLRGTACFNAVPLRTRKQEDLSKQAWKMGTRWSMKVLEHVSPKLVLCNGSGGSRSPWAAVHDAFTLEDIREIPIMTTAAIKSGVIANGKLNGTRVIGLPFLGRFKRPAVFQELALMGTID